MNDGLPAFNQTFFTCVTHNLEKKHSQGKTFLAYIGVEVVPVLHLKIKWIKPKSVK